MKSNCQRGTIYEPSGSFFARYFANIDGVKQRVSHKQCDRDEEHYSITAPPVLALRDEHMVTTRKSKPNVFRRWIRGSPWAKEINNLHQDTAVIEATGGNYAVAQALLRHKTMDTTLRVHKKQITPQGLSAGMQAFQKSLGK